MIQKSIPALVLLGLLAACNGGRGPLGDDVAGTGNPDGSVSNPSLPTRAQSGFPDQLPNDPLFPAEHHFFSDIPPDQFPFASDPEGAAGMSITAVWADPSFGSARAGRPDVLIAYFDGGANWDLDRARDLFNRIYLNRGELPCPMPVQAAGTACHDADGNGFFNVTDYADDPRVEDSNGNGHLDPEDVIVAFTDGIDDDGNGFVDDISGWDTLYDQNNPKSPDLFYGHATAQMLAAAAEPDNNIGSLGTCPNCMLLPVKINVDGLSRADDLARGMMYAADAGADVLILEGGVLGYSQFMRDVVEYLWRNDVWVAEITHDFNSTSHAHGMYWPHSVPANAFVARTKTLSLGGMPDPTVTGFRARSAITSWGPKNLVTTSVSHLGSTSEAGGVLGGVLGAIRSCAREFEPAHAPYRVEELQQVLITTASDTDSIEVGWPTRPGWDLQTGYGRINVHKACQAVQSGDVPPVSFFNTPAWFSVWDPTQSERIEISGRVAAPRSSSYSWQLEYAPGAEPDEFITLASGDAQVPYEGVLGTLELSDIPESFWQSEFALSRNKELETAEQYTVTLRLVVVDAQGRRAEERRAISVQHDPSALAGFPLRGSRDPHAAAQGAFSSDLAGQTKLADLQGSGRLAIIYGDMDGVIHALDPMTQQELPGWPVYTDSLADVVNHPEMDPLYESTPLPVAVGDLDGDGHLWVLATSVRGRVYAWNAQGQRRAGFPYTMNLGVTKRPLPRPVAPLVRPPMQAGGAPPVLYDLDDDGKLEIIIAGMDGHLHVLRGDGSAQPGWPVHVQVPESLTPQGYLRYQDDNLACAPVIADLDGDGQVEIVIRTQQTDVSNGSPIPFPIHHVAAYRPDGSSVPGWPNSVPGTLVMGGSGIGYLTDTGADQLAVADVDGDGNDEVAVSPIFSPAYLLDGDGSVMRVLGLTPGTDLAGILLGDVSASELTGTAGADAPVNIASSGAFGRLPGGLAFAQPGAGAYSMVAMFGGSSQGVQLRNYERIIDAVTGLPLAQAPFTQGLNFYGSPIFVDVTGDGVPEIVDGGDSAALHAFDALGQGVDGFPKYTAGWTIWSPSSGDLDGDGKTELVTTTREGYVFVWQTEGVADGNQEWWASHHDEWNTSRYGEDTRPPGALRDLQSSALNRSLSFQAPGDDWYSGKVDAYRIVADGVDLLLPATVAAGQRESLGLPVGVSSGLVQAVDEAGNLGHPATFELGAQ